MKPPIEYRPSPGKLSDPAYKEAQKTRNRIMSAQVEAIAATAKFDRNAYQREYMRRWRARKAEK